MIHRRWSRQRNGNGSAYQWTREADGSWRHGSRDMWSVLWLSDRCHNCRWMSSLMWVWCFVYLSVTRSSARSKIWDLSNFPFLPVFLPFYFHSILSFRLKLFFLNRSVGIRNLEKWCNLGYLGMRLRFPKFRGAYPFFRAVCVWHTAVRSSQWGQPPNVVIIFTIFELSVRLSALELAADTPWNGETDRETDRRTSSNA